MNAPAAISATFSDFRLIKGRKCAQLVFEVPLELADAALTAMGGVPMPEAERWCAIARMDMEKAQKPAQALPGEKAARPFHTLPYAQQAALKCGDKSFRDFLGVATENDAAIRIREECRVKSRSEIESDDVAKDRWHQIMRDFDRYQQGYR